MQNLSRQTHDSLAQPFSQQETLVGAPVMDAPPSADSFSAVVEAHWTAVYRLLYSLTGSSHDTEDLAQETFLRALRRWDSFKKGTNLRAWLLRIGTNDFFEVKRKNKALKINVYSEELECETVAVETQLENKEQGELIRAAVGELSELTRIVFHLRVSEDLSFREVAELAG